MPRSYEAADPTRHFPSPDTEAWRHFGDTYAGKLVASRIQGYDSSSLAYVDIAVDSNGNLKLAADVAVTIGTVDQGAAGTAAWKVTDTALVALTDGTLRVGGTVTVTGALTDTQLRASAVPVSIASMPSTPVTGPLTDTQLRATAVPVSATLAAETTKVIGTVNQGTSPWVVSGGANVFHIDDNAGSLTVDSPVGTPVFTRLSDGAAALIGQKAMTASLPVVIASDQASLPVAATLATGTAAIGSITNTGFNVTGTDGVTTGLAATVKTYNGANVMFTRDPATLSLLSDILAELYELNTNIKELS